MSTTSARLGAATATVTTAVLGATLLAAPVADAAPTVTTRTANFTASATTVTRGAAVTFKGQTQRLTGTRWVALPNTVVTVWFDADGTAANRSMGTFRSNSLANLAPRFVPATSGYWTIRVSQTATLKSSVTVRKYVRVTTPTSYRPPAGSWNCPSWAPIKGNLSSHIYHMPWQRYYSRTKPEMCFANEAAAIRAGYRKSKV